MIALTAIANGNGPVRPGGSLRSTHVMHNDWSRRERDIHDVIIRNVIGYSQLCLLIRLLSCNARIWNVVVDGVIDTAPENVHHWGGIAIGEADGTYGKNLPDGIKNISISNIISRGNCAIGVYGYLKDSVISNVVNQNPEGTVLEVTREDCLINVMTSNMV